ncbi:MAG: hypothetical protein HOF74_09340 [Gammaproteobacteria bacterium]|jgi:hypothetical protein|nr:hypothetical protein [Gammaproteobacteria bacterium]MBT3860020.1 hypothetical protein [Gammaproteobacteria bacterium]MBT3987030.1 hypothetical protein [Gammaproteobacteria bacterium]MBT4254497.1 hypothetical protein [Gammaproteobacteria bacterium]MBT4580705.1 hypothetical protein [Gammaproteobacteria bacterium]
MASASLGLNESPRINSAKTCIGMARSRVTCYSVSYIERLAIKDKPLLLFRSIRLQASAMLGKILLTLLVSITAYIYVRQRNMKESKDNSPKARKQQDNSENKIESDIQETSTLSADLRLGAYMFLALTIGLACALYYFDWQDDHRILTVTLHGDNQADTVTYEVYKYQLGERTFTTLDGLVVTVASSERMEIDGLNP